MRKLIICALGAAAASLLLAHSVEARPVKSGAMDICKLEEGTVSQSAEHETCCAEPVTEFEDGHLSFGQKYCVICKQGTDDCWWYENSRSLTPRVVFQQHRLELK